VTGLIWEVKQNLDGIGSNANPHDADNAYTWYNSDPAINLGDSGTPATGTDTEDFINALNTAQFGRFSDWRIPTQRELHSLVHYGRFNSSINTWYFPTVSVPNLP